MNSISYARFQVPPTVIQHAVWLYLRFDLSLRDVEDLLAERGLDVGYETIHRRVARFGTVYAKLLRARCLIPGFNGAVFSQESKDSLWARFCMGAPRRRRRSPRYHRAAAARQACGSETDASDSHETRRRSRFDHDRQTGFVSRRPARPWPERSPCDRWSPEQQSGEFASACSTTRTMLDWFQEPRNHAMVSVRPCRCVQRHLILRRHIKIHRAAARARWQIVAGVA